MKKILLMVVFGILLVFLLTTNSKVATCDSGSEVIDVVAIVDIGGPGVDNMDAALAKSESYENGAQTAQQANLVYSKATKWRGTKTTKAKTLANNDNGRALIAANCTNAQGGQLPNIAPISTGLAYSSMTIPINAENDGSTVLKLLTERNTTAA